MSELFGLRFERKPMGSIERAFAQFFVKERSRKKLEICSNRVRKQRDAARVEPRTRLDASLQL